jgi:cellulose biosynthesis protein BcsQ
MSACDERKDALAAWDRRPERFPVDLARVLGQVPAGTQDVILDLPPSEGAIVRGTLAVLPGGVLAAVQTRALDLVGFTDLTHLLTELAEQNPALYLAGVVPMRVNRTALSGEVLAALRQQHGKRVLPGIREATAVARAPLRHVPLQHIWKSVVRTSAHEYVTTLYGSSPARPWLPRLQCACWWAVAVFICAALACKVVGE